LFLVVLVLVVLLGAAEMSIALHEPRIDPRPHIMRYARVVGDKVRDLERRRLP